MKIAVPTANGKLNAHFGHCEAFTVLEVDEAAKTISSVSSIDAPPHEPGLLPAWLGDRAVNMIIAGGMGQRARMLFEERGIHVITGAPCDSPENLVRAYLDSSLVTGENTCDH